MAQDIPMTVKVFRDEWPSLDMAVVTQNVCPVCEQADCLCAKFATKDKEQALWRIRLIGAAVSIPRADRAVSLARIIRAAQREIARLQRKPIEG